MDKLAKRADITVKTSPKYGLIVFHNVINCVAFFIRHDFMALIQDYTQPAELSEQRRKITKWIKVSRWILGHVGSTWWRCGEINIVTAQNIFDELKMQQVEIWIKARTSRTWKKQLQHQHSTHLCTISFDVPGRYLLQMFSIEELYVSLSRFPTFCDKKIRRLQLAPKNKRTCLQRWFGHTTNVALVWNSSYHYVSEKCLRPRRDSNKYIRQRSQLLITC